MPRPPDTLRRSLAKDRDGAAAVEFAIVSIPFVGLALGLAVLALNFYLQTTIDLAVQKAARQVQLGRVPSSYSAADFLAKVFCPALLPFTSCQDVTVTMVPVTDYENDAVVTQPPLQPLAGSGLFCLGQPGQLMFMRVVYVAPIINQFWPYGGEVSVNGRTSTAFVSTAAFANENPFGAPIPAAGGC